MYMYTNTNTNTNDDEDKAAEEGADETGGNISGLASAAAKPTVTLHEDDGDDDDGDDDRVDLIYQNIYNIYNIYIIISEVTMFAQHTFIIDFIH